MKESYGNYILQTGKGVVGQQERVMGRYLYCSRFAGKKPIVDVGSGRCWFTKQAPDDIIAVDNAPELIEHFRAQGIDIRLGDACALPFDNDSVEGIFCCWLIEHLSRPEMAFNEFYRVLKPGGYACVIAPTPHNMSAFYDDYTHIRPFTAASLTQLAEGARFSRCHTEYLPWVRGITRVIKYFGHAAANSYMSLADRYLRKFGLQNRNNIMLDAWK